MPGALLKGFLEHLFCRICGIPVEYAEYMQRNELCGHTEHLLAPHRGSFSFCFGPHIIMLILGMVTAFPASIDLFYLGTVTPADVILCYIGISFLTNCFPMVEDALNMWDNLYGTESAGEVDGAGAYTHKPTKGASKVLLAIPAAIMTGGAYIESWGVTLITSCVFTYFLSFIAARIVG